MSRNAVLHLKFRVAFLSCSVIKRFASGGRIRNVQFLRRQDSQKASLLSFDRQALRATGDGQEFRKSAILDYPGCFEKNNRLYSCPNGPVRRFFLAAIRDSSANMPIVRLWEQKLLIVAFGTPKGLTFPDLFGSSLDHRTKSRMFDVCFPAEPKVPIGQTLTEKGDLNAKTIWVGF